VQRAAEICGNGEIVVHREAGYDWSVTTGLERGTNNEHPDALRILEQGINHQAFLA
jgi:hypothetical protein